MSYLQRGGSPTLRDRMLATLTGAKAVELLKDDSDSKAIGTVDGEIAAYDLIDALEQKKRNRQGDVRFNRRAEQIERLKMKIAVVYTSKYGTTQQYAQWIAKDVGADLLRQDACKVKDLEKYECLVLAGLFMPAAF